jgi:glycosyltransferase involved in cell wall biosynthesis
MNALAGRTILQVIPDLSAGGAERTTIEVAEAIVAAGGRALVASRGGRLEAALQGVGGEVIHMDAAAKNPRRIWANSRRLGRLVRSEGIDLIHARSRAPAWSALWAARATKRPFVTTYHGAYNARSGLKRFYNSVMARGDMVIANSGWIGDHIHMTHGTPRDRIVVIPRGVDLNRYDPGQVIGARLEAARRSFGLSPQERTVILLPARLTRWKGHPEAIDAFAMLNGELRASCVLIFAGDAQGREDYVTGLMRQAERLGVARQLRILGHVDDIPAALMASDLVIAPSIEPEAFGRAVAEASAMAIPVIGADHGGARETIIHNQTGLRVEPGNAQSLAAAMQAILSMDAGRRRAMGLAGQDFIRRTFSTAALQDRTLKVYVWLLKQSDGAEAA